MMARATLSAACGIGWHEECTDKTYCECPHHWLPIRTLRRLFDAGRWLRSRAGR